MEEILNEDEFLNLEFMAKRALFKHGKKFDEGIIIIRWELERLKREGEFVRAEGLIRYKNGRLTYMIEGWNAAAWLVSQKNLYWSNKLKYGQEDALRRIGLSLERKKTPSADIYNMVLTEATINPDFAIEKIIEGDCAEYYLDGLELVGWFRRKRSEINTKAASPERKQAYYNFLKELDRIKNGSIQGLVLDFDQQKVFSEAETRLVRLPEQAKEEEKDVTSEYLKAISYYMAKNPLETIESFAEKDEMYGDVDLSKWLRDKMSDFYSGKMSAEEGKKFAFLQDEGEDYDPIAHDLGDDYEF